LVQAICNAGELLRAGGLLVQAICTAGELLRVGGLLVQAICTPAHRQTHGGKYAIRSVKPILVLVLVLVLVLSTVMICKSLPASSPHEPPLPILPIVLLISLYFARRLARTDSSICDRRKVVLLNVSSQSGGRACKDPGGTAYTATSSTSASTGTREAGVPAI
jgi:hypothetical protein